jgi:hypothetical protein
MNRETRWSGDKSSCSSGAYEYHIDLKPGVLLELLHGSASAGERVSYFSDSDNEAGVL